MKSYRVVIPDMIAAKVQEQARNIAVKGKAPLNALRWLERITTAVESLATAPRRCPLAPESAFRPYEIRSLNIDGYLILFTIDDAKNTVLILNARHGRQLPQPDQLQEQ